MRACSALFIMRKMQIKITKRDYSLKSEWLLAHRQKITNFSEDVEKREHLYTAGVSFKLLQALIDTRTEAPQKIKIRLSCNAMILLLDIYPKEMKSACQSSFQKQKRKLSIQTKECIKEM